MKMDKTSPNFLYFGLDEMTKALIHKVCGNTPYVELAPLDKGLSGSLALMGRWRISGAPSKFHVFKIGNKSKLEREYKAITEIAAPLVRNFPNVTFECVDSCDKAILSQEFMGDDLGRARSLKQYIESAPAADQVIEALRRLYTDSIIHWIPSTPTDPVVTTLEQELHDWLEKADIRKALLETGESVVAKGVSARFGIDVKDIPKLIQRIARESVKICRGPVHGDLHAQNIIMDDHDRMSLIDFGWTGIRWRAIDYLWLECSLKFVVSSPYAQLDDLLRIDEVSDAAWTSDKDVDPMEFLDLLHGQSLAKIAAGVAVIRRYARTQTPMLTADLYQKGLALMAYSLTTFPQLNRVYLIHSLSRYLSKLQCAEREIGPYDRLYSATEILWPDRAGRMVRKAITVASKPGRALDLGCGDGKNLVFLEENGWSVTGVDVSGLAIDGLQRRIRRYYGNTAIAHRRVVKCDAAKFKYVENEYDLVVAYGLYHCLNDDELKIVHRGIVESLKSGGLFAFASFNDELPVPDGHETGELYLRPSRHIFDLVGDSMEIIAEEIGEIEESHLPTIGVHRHKLTWGLFRKR